MNYADSGTATITIRATDPDTNFVETAFTVTVNAGVCVDNPPVFGSGGTTGNSFSAGFCTVLGDNYNVGNNYTIEDHVKIGDNFTAGNGQGGPNVEIFAGAIIGDNVNAGTTDVAAGVIIPDGITL